ncbi:ATP-binding protein [Acinetobacter pollinis]|uniref:ATP-binding protein n=1 Tax=Acinetobacter pollinis TaxID=2605270 RepID=UPI0018A2FFD5|nr:ATP-binding protein [Acinetobacter pollinis]MBF7689912.1 response regulator [Acinetobacter pollinis]MBF7692411.1 response regulator [Acinetobacter pollinis]MBF7697236.1 response regulator [Acinetobacter pollinis]MBF7701113.1 response regulator [Acinetobacter pollinis]
MAQLRKNLLQRLQLNHAYGQLVAFIFIPISVLVFVGTTLVVNETRVAAKSQQQYAAIATLSRYQHTAKLLSTAIDTSPNITPRAENILQSVLNEQYVQRVAIIDSDNHIKLNIGQRRYLPWPTVNDSARFIGPISYNHNTVYGSKIMTNSKGISTWLLIELDDQPLALAHYRILTVLAITGFITLLLLMMCLNFYSRRWIAPLYEIRMQLQRLSADNLDQPITLNSSGELKLLQRDIENTLQRLHHSFLELKDHTEQTEDDLRRTLDTLEVQNITYRQARDQAISANQSKSVFLANISHELRTPLNSIDGFIHLMLRQDNLTNDQNLYLQTIRKSSAHLLALINDVLDFSKIDAGKLELETAQFNLEETIFDVMDMLSPLAAQKNINMAFYFAHDLPQYVIGDTLRFKQILTNLISNAIKFTPEGEIIVRTRLENKNHQHCQIYFSVQDSGIGVSEQDRKKLFDSFSQVDASITRQFGGTGLGLAISKQLVQMMHGHIGFEDNQERTPTEKGSTFWFNIQFDLDQRTQHIQKENLSHVKVVSFISHAATANILRHYLENYNVQHTESISLLDLFNRLNQLTNHDDTWVIVDHAGDTHTLLQEIRMRYQGHLAVYGYQMALEPNTLSQFHATPLYQPLSRHALLQLLKNQIQVEEEHVSKTFNGEGLHVLAVDDHLPNLIVLEALLAELKVKTTKALSGQEALRLIQNNIEQKQQPFDLIFMDIQMPVMSGVDTTRAIRSLESTLNKSKEFPIIALTAHALSDEKQNLLTVGMNDYVTKPIQIEQLVQILTTWTNSRFENNQTPLHNEFSTTMDSNILDWAQSVKLAANKEELAVDLLKMLTESFDAEVEEMQQLIELEDFPQLEHVLHRLYGATRYVGTPKLQEITGDFEQFISTLRKEKRRADQSFIQETLLRFNELKKVIQHTREAAQKKLSQYLNP